MVRTLSRRALVWAISFAGFAGFVDGFGFSYLGGFFVSFMSGNTTQSGVELVQGSIGAAGFGLLLIASFVIGVAVGTSVSAGRAGEVRVVVLVLAASGAAALAAELDARILVGALLAGAMGATNTVFAAGGEVSYGLTYMTGALVKVGQGVVSAVRGGDRWAWRRPLALWTAMALGAVGGAAAYLALGVHGLWLVVGVLAGVVAVPGLRRRLRA